MKFFIVIIIFLGGFVNTNAQSKSNLNGWEFLEWGTDSVQVNKLVKKKRAKNELRYPNALDASFRFQDMNTWLDYDSLKRLNKITQRITFSVHQQKQAHEVYEKIRTRMFADYGIPRIEKRDTTECNTNIYWDLKHTKIHLEYDYQYKVIDELGAGSYWVYIFFEKAE